MSFLVTARVIFQTLFPRTLGDPAELLHRLATEETREKVGIFFLPGVYQYADEEERAYYTQWKRDFEAQWKKEFETNAYNNGEKDARMSIAETLASNGFDAEKIASFTGLSSSDVQAALQVNSQP